MKFSSEFLVVFALFPLLAGVALQFLFARLLSPRGKGILAVACCVPSLCAVLAVFPMIRGGGALDFTAFSWDGPLSLAFHVDALSIMFALMATGLGVAVLIYSIDYMAEDRSATRFYAFMLTFICAMVGLVYSSNLFVFYLCWEAMGLCSFSLVGFWYKDPAAVAGARKVLLMTHLAGYGLLAAILTIYIRTGSALWTNPAVARAFSGGVFALMLVALVAKSVQFPLHTWIPEAMAAPTPVSALLHAACYVKAGVYLAARMHSFGQWPLLWGASMMWLGTVTMVVGVVYAMVQTDLKRMLAFHTVSQIGYMITGIGLGTPLGVAAALLHCLNHSLFKGGLFLAAGAVQHSTGTRDMNQLGGLSRRMPRTTIVWLISAGSMMGIPLMSGFASKWLLYTAALQAGQVVPALAAWVVSIGTVFSCVKATSSVFLGPVSERTAAAHEAPPTMLWALGLFGAGSVVLGVAPQLAVQYLINPILPVLGMSAVQVSWFGLASSAGGWWSTAGLMLGVFAAVVGAMVYAMAGASRMRVVVGGNVALAAVGGGAGAFSGGESLPGTGRLPASEFSAVLKQQWAPFFRRADVDGYYRIAWEYLLTVSRQAARLVLWVESRTSPLMLGLMVLLICLLRWVAPSGTVSVVRGVEGMPRLLAVSTAIACFALVVSAVAVPKLRRLAPLMMLSGAVAVTGMLSASPMLRIALLESSTLLALLLVWRCCGDRRAAWTYTAVVGASAVSLIAGQVLLAHGYADWARAFLVSGFLIKLAVVPFFFWLPQVAETLPSLVTGLLIAVIDIAAFGELICAVQSDPGLLAAHGIWVSVAIASALLASLLMLSERSLKRLLALSTIEDMGFLTFAVASASTIGMQGAVVGASVHALAKALLFISISTPEADGALSNESRGLITRYPMSAAAFLVGMLAMLGIPPTMGFSGRWRIYETAAQSSPWLLGGLLLSSMFALIAYVLTLSRAWWGPAAESVEGPTRRSILLNVTVIGLIAVLLVGGLWPNLLPALLRGGR